MSAPRHSDVRGFESALRDYAREHGLRTSGRDRAVCDAFEIVIECIPTAEPSYVFAARRTSPGADFSVFPRPPHMPFPEPTTGDAAFDEIFMVRPTTPEAIAALDAGVRRALVEHGPCNLAREHGTLIASLSNSLPPFEKLRTLFEAFA